MEGDLWDIPIEKGVLDVVQGRVNQDTGIIPSGALDTNSLM